MHSSVRAVVSISAVKVSSDFNPRACMSPYTPHQGQPSNDAEEHITALTQKWTREKTYPLDVTSKIAPTDMRNIERPLL